MIGAVEWSGWQQIVFLVECIPCGAILGFFFELTSGFVRFSTSKSTKYLYDVLYGMMASVVTFFTALVIMDGQLHPILFLGIGFGFICEHIMLGRLVMQMVYMLVKTIGKVSFVLRTILVCVFRVFWLLKDWICCIFVVNVKNYEKNS